MKFINVVFNSPLHTDYTYSYDPDKFDIKVGQRVKVSFGKRKKLEIGAIIKVFDKLEDTKYKIKEINSLLDKDIIFSLDQLNLAIWMKDFFLCSLGQALFSMFPSKPIKETLDYTFKYSDIEIQRKTLSKEQENALLEIESSKEKQFYLMGITGSGKTEVYLRLSDAMIKKGKQVIYLVPEITLTHQIIETAKKRYKDIAILHSNLTLSQRVENYNKIIKGQVKFIIGARSAIFAPVSNLGLIIIDEEHDSSYKSNNTPRYHARQIAQRRIKMHDAKLLMGSATPSLEAYRLIKEEKIKTLYLKERVAGGVLPNIEIVDLNFERGIISEHLYKRIGEVLDAKKQAILFLNRRGFKHYWKCKTCGSEAICPNCSVNMIMHKKENKMVCHYCGHTQSIAVVCPSCGSTDIVYGGFGTEHLEDHIKELFPSSRVARLDRDVANGSKKEVKQILNDFKDGQYDILLGTQMIAKGLNFPNVRLVAIVLADTSLNIPDFRAGEKNFSNFLQVSGRAGRFDEEGVVVIQTNDPNNHSIQHTINHDVFNYFDKELEKREMLGFPPYQRLVRFVIRSKNKKAARDEIIDLNNWIRDLLDKTDLKCSILGCSECPIEKIDKNYRYQIILRSKDFKDIQIVAHTVYRQYKESNAVYIETDVDPISIL